MSREKEIFDDIEGLVVEDARKTYSKKVIDHFMNPRNLGMLENHDCFNAMSGMCGDTIGIYVGLGNDIITRDQLCHQRMRPDHRLFQRAHVHG